MKWNETKWNKITLPFFGYFNNRMKHKTCSVPLPPNWRESKSGVLDRYWTEQDGITFHHASFH